MIRYVPQAYDMNIITSYRVILHNLNQFINAIQYLGIYKDRGILTFFQMHILNSKLRCKEKKILYTDRLKEISQP